MTKYINIACELSGRETSATVAHVSASPANIEIIVNGLLTLILIAAYFLLIIYLAINKKLS